MFLGYEVAKLSSEVLGLDSKDLSPEGGAKRRPDRASDRPTVRNALSAEGAIGWAKSHIT